MEDFKRGSLDVLRSVEAGRSGAKLGLERGDFLGMALLVASVVVGDFVYCHPIILYTMF